MTAIKGFKNLVSTKVDEDLMITVVAGNKDTVATRELLDIPNPTLHTIHTVSYTHLTLPTNREV